MKKKTLMSIGELSKQTGVHIKSLRYYDHLGILQPAYVDPNSGYRYYDLHQIPVVEAIQLCIDLDIPLKNFTDYYVEQSQQFHYAKLIDHGTALAKKKIQIIQERLSRLEQIQAEIQRGELVMQSSHAVRCRVPAIDAWLEPCSGDYTNFSTSTQLHQIMRQVDKSGMKVGYYAGSLLRCQGNRQELFFFIEVEIPAEMDGPSENIFHIPAGEYLCIKRQESSIMDAANLFPEQFALDYEKIVIESELSLMDYDYVTPPLELRCLLPN